MPQPQRLGVAFVLDQKSKFPKAPREVAERFVGRSESVGVLVIVDATVSPGALNPNLFRVASGIIQVLAERRPDCELAVTRGNDPPVSLGSFGIDDPEVGVLGCSANGDSHVS